MVNFLKCDINSSFINDNPWRENGDMADVIYRTQGTFVTRQGIFIARRHSVSLAQPGFYSASVLFT
ncbi:hypothetical protein HCU01_08470 [Halomonas cupida]|uniref:Pectinesterase n=1 Tax=Halomonas cupida TaxID=44933 RepID=A0ABQ0WDW5_9GAMM|nr:hypothetical protein HCU01_08470 [Halomonas cupida]